VELAVALHYVYQTPYDRLLWDVGHQAYPHKVLTGRREELGGIRLKGGLAPFPARQESEYDAFGVGHSSTSLSAAFGMAIAAKRTATPRRIVAVTGDGGMSAGIAFEALNHIGSMDLDMLVVLNDNDMSISEATGAFSNYLAELLSGQYYAKLRERGMPMLRGVPPALALARGSEAFVREIVRPRTIFDDMGLHYVGPIDGHDVGTLVTTLKNLRGRSGPQLLHVVTTKGKGYAPAETDPITWHGPGPFDRYFGINGCEERIHQSANRFLPAPKTASRLSGSSLATRARDAPATFRPGNYDARRADTTRRGARSCCSTDGNGPLRPGTLRGESPRDNRN
jgi:1-deoxy-D-xylulose-5-phosphate synthase